MSRIFETQNQFIIRFPEKLAEQLSEAFQNNEMIQLPDLEIGLDKDRQKEVNGRLALKFGINGEQYKATLMELPTISSTFKTLDRINYFKSNDICEMIVVHESQADCENIYEDMAEKVKDKNQNRVEKFNAESGITKPTKYIKQINFKQKPEIDKQKVGEVDREMEAIRFNNSQVKQKEKQEAKDKKDKLLSK